jgi:hypothetical protein
MKVEIRSTQSSNLSLSSPLLLPVCFGNFACVSWILLCDRMFQPKKRKKTQQREAPDFDNARLLKLNDFVLFEQFTAHMLFRITFFRKKNIFSTELL